MVGETLATFAREIWGYCECIAKPMPTVCGSGDVCESMSLLHLEEKFGVNVNV